MSKQMGRGEGWEHYSRQGEAASRPSTNRDKQGPDQLQDPFSNARVKELEHRDHTATAHHLLLVLHAADTHVAQCAQGALEQALRCLGHDLIHQHMHSPRMPCGDLILVTVGARVRECRASLLPCGQCAATAPRITNQITNQPISEALLWKQNHSAQQACSSVFFFIFLRGWMATNWCLLLPHASRCRHQEMSSTG